MKLIKSSFEILEQEPGIQGIYKQIERAGRTCYKSEDRITEDSAEKFVNMIKDRQHTAMLEHGTVYLKDVYDVSAIGSWRRSIGYKYTSNKYSKVTVDESADFRNIYITTNYRVLYENNWLDDLKYLCEPTEYHQKRVTVKFICDRGVSHEFVRHRVFSFAQESTRYCNYNKDKFNNELTFIIPNWSSLKEARYVYWDGDYVENTTPESLPHTILKHVVGDVDDIFLSVCENTELSYKYLINNNKTPQEARSILPNSLKTELVMTGTIEQWKGFFKLRCDVAAHPQARELAIPLKDEFIKRHLLNEN